MIFLYDGGGNKIISLLGPELSEVEAKNLIMQAKARLLAKGESEAARYIEEFNFILINAVNEFEDSFSVLTTWVLPEQYQYWSKRIAESPNEQSYYQIKRPFEIIASAINELRKINVRFVICQGLDLVQEGSLDSVHNQALFSSSSPSNPKFEHEGLNFRSKVETKIFDARRRLLRPNVIRVSHAGLTIWKLHAPEKRQLPWS
jgi:hypothetical protein